MSKTHYVVTSSGGVTIQGLFFPKDADVYLDPKQAGPYLGYIRDAAASSGINIPTPPAPPAALASDVVSVKRNGFDRDATLADVARAIGLLEVIAGQITLSDAVAALRARTDGIEAEAEAATETFRVLRPSAQSDACTARAAVEA